MEMGGVEGEEKKGGESKHPWEKDKTEYGEWVPIGSKTFTGHSADAVHCQVEPMM